MTPASVTPEPAAMNATRVMVMVQCPDVARARRPARPKADWPLEVLPAKSVAHAAWPSATNSDALSGRFRRPLIDRLAHAYFVRCDRRAGWSADDCVDRGALVRGSDALATGETQCTVVSSDLLWRCRARSGLPRSE
jgi:hypothetical protein